LVESYVVDASVVSKWFNRGEQFEKESNGLRKAWVDDKIELVAPSHLPFEVANSIWKNPNIHARRASRLVRVLVRVSPKLDELSEEIAGEAMAIARRKGLTFYDASYLALSKIRSLSLITVDDDQIHAASGYVRASHVSAFSS
jgi:predicted nucleic acid-binding protein